MYFTLEMFLGFISINLEHVMKLGIIYLSNIDYKRLNIKIVSHASFFLKVYGRQLIPSYPEDYRESSQGYE